MGYGCSETDRMLRLYTSSDGKKFSSVKDFFGAKDIQMKLPSCFSGSKSLLSFEKRWRRRDGDDWNGMFILLLSGRGEIRFGWVALIY